MELNSSELSRKILSDITVYAKYAKYIPNLKRRETWEEATYRNMLMHIKKFPSLEEEIIKNYMYVIDKKVLPSMRSIQFGGIPMEINNARGYNCAFAAVTELDVFAEAMFLLLSGCGFSYSVQKHHIDKLPDLVGPSKRRRNYLIGDSIIGWADAIKVLIYSYFKGKSDPVFDYRDIRPKGSLLITSGGKAPGPGPLKDCIYNIRKILDNAISERGVGTKLKSIEAHDIMCYIADAVLSGGIRRAACLAGFSFDDEDMLSCKSPEELERNPQRHRANNSVVLLKRKLDKMSFDKIFDLIKKSFSGEPGIIITNDKDYLFNPCQPGWAKLLTKSGIKQLNDIKVGDDIWSKEGWTKVIKKWSTGVKKVYKYETTAGIFYGTENHRLVSNGTKIEAKDCESVDIISGEFSSTVNIDIRDVMDGMVIGDGSVHKESNNLVYLCIGQDDTDYFKSEIKDLIIKHRPGLSEEAYEIDTTITSDELSKTYSRCVPERFIYDRNKCIGFLRGIYTVNGSVVRNRITLKSASKKIIEDVQLMLSSLGIRSYYTTNKEHNVEFNNGNYTCKESYDLNISTDRDKFVKLIGFIQDYKNEKIDSSVSGNAKTTYDIINVELVSEEEVFDLTVDNNSHTYWTQGCNVSNCGEASLKSKEFCNLTTINGSNITDQEDFDNRARVAAFIGTLQASYTDFHYLSDDWKKNSEKDALLGVSMTGIASEKIMSLNYTQATKIILQENERVAKLIGINKAARTTLLKPEGTTSLVLGCSSGIHGWHSDKYYIRRIRLNKDESLYRYISNKIPELLEDDYFKPNSISILSMPVKVPEGAITRNESAIELINRCIKISKEWIKPGHRSGANTHNVSATITVKDNEWEEVREHVWNNINTINGMTFYRYDGNCYTQPPFEECSEEIYNQLISKVKDIDVREILEVEDNTNLIEQAACAGGACTITNA